MLTLPERLKRALAFNSPDSHSPDWARSRYITGGLDENARLAPIHERLIEIVRKAKPEDLYDLEKILNPSSLILLKSKGMSDAGKN